MPSAAVRNRSATNSATSGRTLGSALLALPGIGRITAMTLPPEIGDTTRFPSARKLCAWAGLTPQVRNSDRTIRHGHITKQGSAPVRFVLQEAAERAKTRPPFAGFYAQCAARGGRHIATVAVARKLLARCFHVLTQVDNHQHNHAADHTSQKVTSPGALEVPHAPATRPSP